MISSYLFSVLYIPLSSRIVHGIWQSTLLVEKERRADSSEDATSANKYFLSWLATVFEKNALIFNQELMVSHWLV